MRRPSRATLSRLAEVLVPWAVGILLFLTVVDWADRRTPGVEVVLAFAFAIGQGAALWWRRRRPEVVTAVVLAAGLGFQLLIPESVLPVAGFFAVGSLAAARPPRVSLFGLVGLEALSAVNFATTTVGDTLFTMACGVGAWALGEAARSRRVAIDEAARRAVSEEQARVARELHDVIAHSVSVIVVQAAAADEVFDARPDQARAALRSIERAGRDAMGELRRVLSAVRPDTDVPPAAGPVDPAAPPADPAAPQPGLDRLDDLAAPLRAGGLEVVVRREGLAHALPAGIELSAYRIVQEALTNTLRHARATRAEVTLRYGADALEVDVRDDGRAAGDGAGNGGGRGLVGMRERAALLGGTLEAGRLDRGGYRVHARLPLEAAP
jgi:signal transduction histidine kinase